MTDELTNNNGSAKMNSDKSIDLRGLCCAQPIILLSKELKSLQSGAVLLAIADKSSMAMDIPAFCSQTHNQLIHQEEKNGLFRFWIKKIQ